MYLNGVALCPYVLNVHSLDSVLSNVDPEPVIRNATWPSKRQRLRDGFTDMAP